MKRDPWIICSFAVLLVACESKAGTGALVGGGGGAIVGGALGGWQGAAIGAAAGAVGGAIIGAALDASDREKLQNSPDTLNRIDNGQPLSTYDIQRMSQAGIKDDVIINQIDATHSVFHLTSDQIIQLQQAGVSQKVINHMINTGK